MKVFEECFYLSLNPGLFQIVDVDFDLRKIHALVEIIGGNYVKHNFAHLIRVLRLFPGGSTHATHVEFFV